MRLSKMTVVTVGGLLLVVSCASQTGNSPSTGGTTGHAGAGGRGGTGGAGGAIGSGGSSAGTGTGGESGATGTGGAAGATGTGGAGIGGAAGRGTGGPTGTAGASGAGGVTGTGGGGAGGQGGMGGATGIGGVAGTGGVTGTGGAGNAGGGHEGTGGTIGMAGTTGSGGASCSGAHGLTASGGLAVTATVSFGSPKSSMPSLGLGVCTAVYDNILISSSVATALKAAGVQAVRYPGGSYADAFNWQTTTMNGGSYINTNDTFDNFMNTVVTPAGAKAIVTVNYGSNAQNNGPADPNVAAAWVTYANIKKGWGVKYWEIGNENIGNGYYGNEDWEYDLHYLDQTAANRVGQASLSPAAYGKNAVAFINAMKAVDSSIKCGVGIIQPGGWPDTANPPYNSQVLQGCGSVVDFVIIHWYPDGTEAQLLQAPLQIAGLVSSTRAELNTDVPSRANQIELLITETGAGTVTGPATAIFAVDDYLSWLENGISNVDYQELHSGFLTSGDSGIADNSPEGPYYGAKMSSILAASGDNFVSTSSASNMIGVHAVKKANGHYAIMLLNRDPNNSYTVTVNVSGATLSNCGTRYDFGKGNFNGTYPSSDVSRSIVSGSGASSLSITVPAYTISIVDAPGP